MTKAMTAALLMGLACMPAWAGEKRGNFVKSVTVMAPSTCTKGETLTVKVLVKVRVALNVKVTLKEDDVLFDDTIGTKYISRNPGNSTDWEDTVTFTFKPGKFERGKTLEFYAKAGDAKSSTVKIRCK